LLWRTSQNSACLRIREGKGKGGALGSGTEGVLSTKLETKGVPVLLFWEGHGSAKLPGFFRADIIFLVSKNLAKGTENLF
jgi:hypothetical protein